MKIINDDIESVDLSTMEKLEEAFCRGDSIFATLTPDSIRLVAEEVVKLLNKEVKQKEEK